MGTKTFFAKEHYFFQQIEGRVLLKATSKWIASSATCGAKEKTSAIIPSRIAFEIDLLVPVLSILFSFQ